MWVFNTKNFCSNLSIFGHKFENMEQEKIEILFRTLQEQNFISLDSNYNEFEAVVLDVLPPGEPNEQSTRKSQ